MATKQNLAFELGETWRIPLTLTDSAGESLAGEDIADVQFRLVQDGAAAIDLTTDDEITVDADAGTALVLVGPQHQAGVRAALLSYETRVVMTNGSFYVQQWGALHVRASLFAALGHAPSMVFMVPNLAPALGSPASWIGDLAALDPDGDTSFVWALVDGLSNRFAVNGSTLVIGSAGLSLADVGHTLLPTVRATDSDGNATEATVAVVVTHAAMLSGDLAGDCALMSTLGIY